MSRKRELYTVGLICIEIKSAWPIIFNCLLIIFSVGFFLFFIRSFVPSGPAKFVYLFTFTHEFRCVFSVRMHGNEKEKEN